MAQEDPQGFAVDVSDLDMIANSHLPQAADALRAPINETAQALREIVALYRRVDGQG